MKFYIKKVSAQDAERTTVINSDALKKFFGIQLASRDDVQYVTIIYLPDNIKDERVKIIKKQDFRIFIDKTRFKENDLLFFESIGNNQFSLSIIKSEDSNYNKLNNSLIDNYILTDSMAINDEIINQFANWFISRETITHNYFNTTFYNDINRLLNELKKYENIYYQQFNMKLFEFNKTEINNFIVKTRKNIYQENGSFFEFSQTRSRHMPRAILGDKNYLAFLSEYRFMNIHYNFSSSIKFSGLIFSPQLIIRFIASLFTKPFVICSGLSGSGKTKLAQAFAQWITGGEDQYLIVPVGADWTNREPLLGYPNALNKDEYVSPENGVLDLMIRAKNDYDIYLADKNKIPKPYFLILDEMNLSHVERYFADFLSTMESGDKIPLHKINNTELIVPPSIKLPKNLFIVGTVNIDETTYMFSPKVLDRANTIEFRLTEKNLEDFIDSNIKLNMDLLKSKGLNMSDSFMAMALQETDKNLKPTEADLKLFFSELKKAGAEFGYRTASEMGRLMYMLENLGESGDDLLDIAIMQKLLPKLHGSRNKLTKVLPILGGFCLKNNSEIKEKYLDKFMSNSLTEINLSSDTNIKYKISFEKICRMYKNAVENGFASYAEA